MGHEREGGQGSEEKANRKKPDAKVGAVHTKLTLTIRRNVIVSLPVSKGARDNSQGQTRTLKDKLETAMMSNPTRIIWLNRPSPGRANIWTLRRGTQAARRRKEGASTNCWRSTGAFHRPEKQKFFLGTYVVVVLVLGGLYYLLRLPLLDVGAAVLSFLRRADQGAIAIGDDSSSL